MTIFFGSMPGLMLPTKRKGGRTFQEVGETTELSGTLLSQKGLLCLVGTRRETFGQSKGQLDGLDLIMQEDSFGCQSQSHQC